MPSSSPTQAPKRILGTPFLGMVHPVSFYTDTVPTEWDAFCYDDLISTIRRQGFFDCLGDSLVPSNYDNGLVFYKKQPRRLHTKPTTRQQAQQDEWEAQQRARMIERQRIADEQWEAQQRARVIEDDQRERTKLRAVPEEYRKAAALAQQRIIEMNALCAQKAQAP